MKVAMVVVAVLALAAPAAAQVDFSGEWAPRFWEDQPERVPGPELGDYLGMFVTSSHFKKVDASAWMPTPCEAE